MYALSMMRIKPPIGWRMRPELTLIFIVGHSSCAHRVSNSSLTRFHHCSVCGCFPIATALRSLQAFRSQPDFEKHAEVPGAAVLWINTPDRGAPMPHDREVRYGRRLPVIGIHRLSHTQCVPIRWFSHVCDIRCITAPVFGWPYASRSVTRVSTCISLTQGHCQKPKQSVFR